MKKASLVLSIIGGVYCLIFLGAGIYNLIEFFVNLDGPISISIIVYLVGAIFLLAFGLGFGIPWMVKGLRQGQKIAIWFGIDMILGCLLLYPFYLSMFLLFYYRLDIFMEVVFLIVLALTLMPILILIVAFIIDMVRLKRLSSQPLLAEPASDVATESSSEVPLNVSSGAASEPVIQASGKTKKDSKNKKISLPHKRGVFKAIFFTIITLGIYRLVLCSHIRKETIQLTSEHESKPLSFVAVFFLSVFTLFILPIVWYLKIIGRLKRETERRGIDYRIGPGAYFFWHFLPVVGYLIAEHKFFKMLNKLNLNEEERLNALATNQVDNVSGETAPQLVETNVQKGVNVPEAVEEAPVIPLAVESEEVSKEEAKEPTTNPEIIPVPVEVAEVNDEDVVTPEAVVESADENSEAKVATPKEEKAEKAKASATKTKKAKTEEKPANVSTSKTTSSSGTKVPKSKYNTRSKPRTKPAPKTENGGVKAYHISRRQDMNKWQVKASGSTKAIKMFNTQEEAIKYAKEMAANQGISIRVHGRDGKIRSI